MTHKEIRYYTAAWCAPCKSLKPKVRELATNLGATFTEIDIDTQSGKVPSDLLGVPSVDLYRDGAYLGRLLKEQVRTNAIMAMLVS